MLRTLLESRSRRSGNQLGAAASATIHVTLIVLAAVATAAGSPADVPHKEPDRLHWVTPKSAARSPITPPARATGTRTVLPVTLPSISLAIHAGIPAVDIPLGVVRADDFVSSTGSATNSAEEFEDSPVAAKPAYDAYEVDKAVTAISGVAPAYPASMRSSGVEGDVKAEFVVNESGRAVLWSLRIVSSTNEQFSEAVRNALPRMRFRPAQLGGRAVAQTVQQLFAFRLNR